MINIMAYNCNHYIGQLKYYHNIFNRILELFKLYLFYSKIFKLCLTKINFKLLIIFYGYHMKKGVMGYSRQVIYIFQVSRNGYFITGRNLNVCLHSN